MAAGSPGEKSEEEFKLWFNDLGHDDINVLFDPDGLAFNTYGIRAIPTSVVIDSDGNIIAQQVGPIENQAVIDFMNEIE